MPDRLKIPTTTANAGANSPKDLNPKANAWHVADLYRRDAKKSSASKKPRLPLSTLFILRDGGCSFEDACGLLEVSPTHLRAASARAGIDFNVAVVKLPTIDPHVGIDEAATITVTKGDKEPDMAAIHKILNTPAYQPEDTASPVIAKRDARTITKDERKSIINALATDIELREGKAPSFSRIHRETGFAMETVKKYLERPDGRPFPAQHIEIVNETSPEGSGGAGSHYDFDDEVVQVISEIVFGTGLIKGCYTGPDGAICFDESIKTAGHSVAMIYEWRNHKKKVSEILAAARELLG